MGREQQRGVSPRGRRIRITFQYLGRQCRETLQIPPTEKNLKYAELKRSQILYEIEVGSFRYEAHFPESARAKAGHARSELTVSKAVDLWIRTRVLTDSTRTRYHRIVRKHIDPELGPRPIRNVLRSELEQWRADMARTLRPKTVNNAMIIARGAFDLAHGDGVIKANPAAALRNIKNPGKSHADPFVPAELKAILAQFEGQQLNLVDFWWTTGMREGELFGLEWPDIDWTAGSAHVRRAVVEHREVETKTKRDRFVRLSVRALAALRAQRQHTELGSGKVFRNPDTGEPWGHPVVFLKKWERALKRAKVRYRPPKQLRHTYASLALSAGEPPLFVMHQLGHSSLVMLERHYAKWMPSANVSAGRGFDAIAAQA